MIPGKYMTRAGAVMGIAALVCLLAGCAARVKSFSAVPRHVCAGEPVHIQWNVVGSASVTVTPPDAGLVDGPVASEGQATIRPAATTKVALHVTRMLGRSTTSTQEIQVTSAPRKPQVLAASMGDSDAQPGCAGGKAWATVHADRFAPDLKVSTVAAYPGDSRIYDVRHAGLDVAVAPGSPATALRDTPIAGDWILTVPLSPGQTCATIPHNLVIDVYTRCVPGGGQ